jgi:endogenous inhibitor of DNA gyrase (YacG/DUF329 family)
MALRCPTCKKPVDLSSPRIPFCSERCQLIDLGRWSDEEYRIPVVSPGQGVPGSPGSPDEEDE